MRNKPNPMLAKLEAQLEAKYLNQLKTCLEIDRIAMIIAAHRELQVGPGRAAKVLDAYDKATMDIIQSVNEDAKSDDEILYTKRNLAICLKDIFAPEDWEKVKIQFPLLHDYW